MLQILHVSERGLRLLLVALQRLNILIYSLVLSVQLLLVLPVHHQLLCLQRLYLRVELLLVLDVAFLGGELSLADGPEVLGRLDVIFRFKLPVLLLSMGALQLRYFPLVLGLGHHVAQV